LQQAALGAVVVVTQHPAPNHKLAQLADKQRAAAAAAVLEIKTRILQAAEMAAPGMCALFGSYKCRK
jgi:hypothetical protein